MLHKSQPRMAVVHLVLNTYILVNFILRVQMHERGLMRLVEGSGNEISSTMLNVSDAVPRT